MNQDSKSLMEQEVRPCTHTDMNTIHSNARHTTRITPDCSKAVIRLGKCELKEAHNESRQQIINGARS
jgi:hypothetical protein